MFLRKIVVYSVFFLAVNAAAACPLFAGQQPRFSVQVETLSFEPAARAVVKRLNARGYDAYFAESNAAGGKTLYKVRFGRFATRQEASAAAKAYRKKEQRDCFVVQGMAGAKPTVPASAAPPSQPASSAGGKAFYTVQIAAKADRAVAQAYADRLRRKGYPVYLQEPAPDEASPFFRIRFGRFASRTQAEKAGRRYAEGEKGDYLVVLSSAQSPQGAVAAIPPVKVAAAPRQQAASGHFFTVQVGVCQTIKAAEYHADRVRRKGFDPYIMEYVTAKGKKLHRVRIGKFKERSRAKELARAYEQKGGRDFIVVRTGQGSVPRGQNETLVEPRPALIQPDPVATAQPAEPSSVQEATIFEDEPVSVGKVQQAGASDTSTARENSIGGGLSGSKAQKGAQSPASSAVQVTRIYAYSGPGNELNLTNAHAKIPRDMLDRIQYVSIFPVLFIEVPEKGNSFIIEVEGERRTVRLSGLRLPEENRAAVSGGIRDILSAEALRLKYHPDDDNKDLLTATLYYRNGTDLQVELLKKGLVLLDEDSLPEARKPALRAAQQRAQELKAGIWSGHTP